MTTTEGHGSGGAQPTTPPGDDGRTIVDAHVLIGRRQTRRLYAAAAITGIAMRNRPRSSYREDAQDAWQYADAMLETEEP